MEAEAGNGEKRGGEVEGVTSGAVPGAGDGAPNMLEDGRAAVVLMDGCLFDRVGASEAVAAACEDVARCASRCGTSVTLLARQCGHSRQYEQSSCSLRWAYTMLTQTMYAT